MVQINALNTFTRNQQTACTLASNELISLITLNAGSLPTEKTPAPLFLVAVLDKSGSMAGSKMIMLQDTVRRLIAKLRPIDTLCLVAYDTNVSVILAPTLMSEENATKAVSVVDQIRSGSSTNLSGGLVEGLNTIPSDLPPNTVVSTLLLTDGLANMGVKTSSGIISLMKHTFEKENAPSKSAVYTFGYGRDHNSQMLREIAEAGNGMYYFIENEDRIADCFADVLGGLLSVVAQNIVLTVEAQEGVSISELLTDYSLTEVSPGKKFRVQMADIQSEENRDIPIRLQIPAESTDCETPLLKISLEYFDSASESVCSSENSLSILRRETLSEAEMKVDAEIDAQVNRVETCAILKKARELGDNRQCEEGRILLKNQITHIEQSASGSMPMCLRLIKDLRTALESMESYSRYASQGSHQISNISSTHSRQRAAPQGYEQEFEGFTYCNAARFDMQSMY